MFLVIPDPMLDDNLPAQAPPGAPRWPLLHHPASYALLAAFFAATYLGDWMPMPETQPAIRVRAIGGEREVPFPVMALQIVLLVLGSGFLVSYVVIRSRNIRVFPRCEFPIVPWDGWHLLRCALVALVLQRLLGAAVAWGRGLGDPSRALSHDAQALLLPLLASVRTAALCVFVLALVAERGRSLLPRIGLSGKASLGRAALGVAGFVLIYPLLFLAVLAMARFGPLFGIHPQPQEVLARSIGLSAPLFLVVALNAVVVAPLAEEIFFRGFFYATLRRYLGPLGAISLSAFAFSFVHGSAFHFLPLFLIGFLLAYLYERTGSLVASIVAHATNNLHSLVVFYLTFQCGAL